MIIVNEDHHRGNQTVRKSYTQRNILTAMTKSKSPIASILSMNHRIAWCRNGTIGLRAVNIVDSARCSATEQL